MKIIRTKKTINEFLLILKKRASGVSPDIEEKVREIIDDVKINGDSAVQKYTQTFDKVNRKSLKLSRKEIAIHASKADKNIVKALKFAAKRIRKFHEKQLDHSWTFTEKGTILGQIIRPLERVGVYVPGGKASYPSTVLMNVIPAQVAGVKEIVVCVPTPNNLVNENVMASLDILDIKEAYCIGGAQAVAALAYGTQRIKKVDKIVGPGNIYVATAKRMVFGIVDIDMIAGPSEILIIADETSNPEFIAADLLSQAEHDELASSILITISNKLAEDVIKELRKQLDLLRRKNIASESLKNYGAIIVVKKIEEAAEISNQIAPEHLEIMTKNPSEILPLIKNAGAIFLGEWTPEALGDYAAGPNHTLPTGGTARFSSPLGVYDFIKRSSLLSFTKEGFRSLANTVTTIAEAEGLGAHAKTITLRKTYF